MRLTPVLAAILLLTAAPVLAQDQPVISVTQVAYKMAADLQASAPTQGFATDLRRDLPFSFGTPEGSGLDQRTVAQKAPRATVRLADRRTRKAFSVPWQTGIFQ